MGTSRILWAPEEFILPTSNPATLTKVTSSGSAPTSGPVVTYNELAFNDTTDQTVSKAIRLPDDYVSGGSVALLWTAAATSGAVVWKCSAVDGKNNSTDLDASSYATIAQSANVTVPGTAGRFLETSIALPGAPFAVGDFLGVMIGRFASTAGDTATGNANIVAVQFSYST